MASFKAAPSSEGASDDSSAHEAAVVSRLPMDNISDPNLYQRAKQVLADEREG